MPEMPPVRETDLYKPIKLFLEHQGYEVKAEVNACDLVAMRGDEPPVVVELKTGFNIALLLQAIDRLALTDTVYVAVPKPSGKAANAAWRRNRDGLLKLCRRIGIGLITVNLKLSGRRAVEVHLDPAPYAPRTDKPRAARLLREFANRVGDPNIGGSTRVKVVTSYRQDALRCLAYIHAEGPARVHDIRAATAVERAAGILQKDHYGWFERKQRGVYGVTPQGVEALATYARALKALAA